MSVCGACGNEVEHPEDDVLRCGHRAHAACLLASGAVETIACPTCRRTLFGVTVKAVNGPMMLVLYILLNLQGAWQAIFPFLLAFFVLQTCRVINWFL